MTTSVPRPDRGPLGGVFDTTPGQAVEFPPNHVIYAQGDPGDRVYLIQSGKVKIGRTSPSGREHLLGLFGPADMVGELSAFDPGLRTTTATTVTDVYAIALHRSALLRSIAENPETADLLLRAVARRLRSANTTITDLVTTDVPGRLAKALLQLAQRFGHKEMDGVRIEHDLSQEEIAQLVGCSRETVNKSLADFSRRGWVKLDGKSVLVLAPERLVRRARQ